MSATLEAHKLSSEWDCFAYAMLLDERSFEELQLPVPDGETYGTLRSEMLSYMGLSEGASLAEILSFRKSKEP